MPDYSAEIAALTAAIATGALEVRYQDRTVRYDSFEKLLARLNWLKGQSGATARPVAGYASFSRGDR